MGGEIFSESIGGYGLHWQYTGVEPTDQQPMPHTSSLAHQSIMHPSLGHVVMISTACYSNGIRIVFKTSILVDSSINMTVTTRLLGNQWFIRI